MPNRPDIAIGNLTLSASTVPQGGGEAVSFSIINAGSAFAAPTTAKLYLSSDAYITASDTLLGTFNIPGLAAGAGYQTGMSVFISSTLRPGTYWIGVLGDTGNVITNETSEANNSYARSFTVSDAASHRPDLVIGDLRLSAPSVNAGSGETITVNIANVGDAAAAATTAKLYLSQDPTLRSGDTLLTTFSIPALGAGQSYTTGVSVVIPANLSGHWYVGVVEDTANVVTNERNEANNSYSTPITINAATALAPAIARPDLEIGALHLSTGTVAAGGGESVGVTFVNTGAAASGATTAHLWLSRDGVITGADTQLLTFSVPALGAGQTFSTGASVLIPANTAAGAWFLGVTVDDGDVVAESNEHNNSFAEGFNVVSGGVTPAPSPGGTAPSDNLSHVGIPLPFAANVHGIRISQGFGDGDHGFGDAQHTLDPFLYYSVDFAVPRGTPVLAQGHGTVVAVSDDIAYHQAGNHGAGSFVTVQYNGFFASYFHLEAGSVTANHLTVGSTVELAQIIGRSGASGDTTMGDHLHETVGQHLIAGGYQGLVLADGALADNSGPPAFFLGTSDGSGVLRANHAYDGNAVRSPGVAPTVEGPATETLSPGVAAHMGGWFFAGAMDGEDIAWWALDDASAGGGHLHVEAGLIWNDLLKTYEAFSGDAPANTVVYVQASQMNGVEFVGGPSGAHDVLYVAGSTAQAWSGWHALDIFS